MTDKLLSVAMVAWIGMGVLVGIVGVIAAILAIVSDKC